MEFHFTSRMAGVLTYHEGVVEEDLFRLQGRNTMLFPILLSVPSSPVKPRDFGAFGGSHSLTVYDDNIREKVLRALSVGGLST
ncbi:MAG: hypothetical protein GHCLOJNM_00706 [bacterium]|nr:hypothetical protein [bacterium]